MACDRQGHSVHSMSFKAGSGGPGGHPSSPRSYHPHLGHACPLSSSGMKSAKCTPLQDLLPPEFGSRRSGPMREFSGGPSRASSQMMRSASLQMPQPPVDGVEDSTVTQWFRDADSDSDGRWGSERCGNVCAVRKHSQGQGHAWIESKPTAWSKCSTNQSVWPPGVCVVLAAWPPLTVFQGGRSRGSSLLPALWLVIC